MEFRPPPRVYAYAALAGLALLASYESVRVVAYRAALAAGPGFQRVTLLNWIANDPAAHSILLEQLALQYDDRFRGFDSGEVIGIARSNLAPVLDDLSTLESLVQQIETWRDPWLQGSGACAILHGLDDPWRLRFDESDSLRWKKVITQLLRHDLRTQSKRVWSEPRLGRHDSFGLSVIDLDAVLAEAIEAAGAPSEAQQLYYDIHSCLPYEVEASLALGPETQRALKELTTRFTGERFVRTSAMTRSLRGQAFFENALECAWRSSDEDISSFGDCLPGASTDEVPRKVYLDSLWNQLEICFDCRSLSSVGAFRCRSDHSIEAEDALAELASVQFRASIELWSELEEIRRKLNSQCEVTRVIALTRLGAARLPYSWQRALIQRSLQAPSHRERAAAIFALGRSVGSHDERARVLFDLCRRAEERQLPILYQAIGRFDGPSTGVGDSAKSFERLDVFDDWLFARLSVELARGSWNVYSCAEAIVSRHRTVQPSEMKTLRERLLVILNDSEKISVDLVEDLFPLLRILKCPEIFQALEPFIDREMRWAGSDNIFELVDGATLDAPGRDRLFRAAEVAIRNSNYWNPWGARWKTCQAILETIRDEGSARRAMALVSKEFVDRGVLKALRYGDVTTQREVLSRLLSHSEMQYRRSNKLELDLKVLPPGRGRTELERCMAENPALACLFSLSSDFVTQDLSVDRIPVLAKILVHRLDQGLGPWESILRLAGPKSEALRREVLKNLDQSLGSRPELFSLARAALRGSPRDWERLEIAIFALAECSDVTEDEAQVPSDYKQRLHAMLSFADRISECLSIGEEALAFNTGLLKCWDRTQNDKGRSQVMILLGAILARWSENRQPIAKWAVENQPKSGRSVLWALLQERLLSELSAPGEKDYRTLLELAEAGWPIVDFGDIRSCSAVAEDLVRALRRLASDSHVQVAAETRLAVRLILQETEKDWLEAQSWSHVFWEIALRGSDEEAIALMRSLSKLSPDSPVLSIVLQRVLAEGPVHAQVEALRVAEFAELTDECKLLAQRARCLRQRAP